jgi:D-alanyl-D-alanine carboxypeptidase/D-alanyl-D-alanine-endopeptidase (penicillin-binding protein 4)
MGDPSLVVEDLWGMVRQLRVAGISKVDGDVIFDADYFDEEYLIPGWDKTVDLANGPSYFAPLGGLTVNHNTVALVVAPGASSGEPARVLLETEAPVIEIDSQVTTGGSGSRRWIKIERELDPSTGLASFTVEGQVPEGGGLRRFYRAAGAPLPHFMSVFTHLLDDAGIEVMGTARPGDTAEDAEAIVVHSSRPLAEIVNHTNKQSSNLFAEHLLKTLGAESSGLPGSTEGGLAVISAYLQSLGIDASEYNLVNGSGLSRDVRLSPSHINAVLLDMYHDPHHAPEFRASLSIGGVDGTLRKRFSEEEEIGRVRGKTGSLNGVYCIAGFVDAGDGEVYAFTFLVNGFRRARSVRLLHDRFGEAMLGMEAAPGGSVAPGIP